jgi:hypothetical protein
MAFWRKVLKTKFLVRDRKQQASRKDCVCLMRSLIIFAVHQILLLTVVSVLTFLSSAN